MTPTDYKDKICIYTQHAQKVKHRSYRNVVLEFEYNVINHTSGEVEFLDSL